MAFIKLYCLLFFATCSIYGDISGNVRKIWNRHEMAYTINSNFGNNQRLLIEQSMRKIEQAVNTGGSTCFSFRNKTVVDAHYLYIAQCDDVCFTEFVGKSTQEKQQLYLSNVCINMREIVSLLVETMGLYPEHRRPDRDQYIQVQMDNVQDAARSQFEVIPPGDTDLLGLPYDFHSVTHYGPYQYAINKSLPTITTNVSGFNFDKRDTLSFYDVLKVQTLYGCPKGYTMFDKDVNRFNQTSADRYYPQWSFTSDKLRDYMNTTCDREGNYTLTALNGATWINVGESSHHVGRRFTGPKQHGHH